MATTDNNTRRFDYKKPVKYNGEWYPSSDTMIVDEWGNQRSGRIFADMNGRYYTLDDKGDAHTAMPVNTLDEVVVTAPFKVPSQDTMSERFNSFLSNNNTKEPNIIAKEDATYVARPLSSMPIRPDLSFSATLKRATRTYSNYSKALDAPFSEEKESLVNAARYVKDHYFEGFPSGASNCTLSATQWINPANPINKAASIVNNPSKYNYARIDSIDALPGDLLIAKVPNNNIYHSMLITGFAKRNKDYNFRGKVYKVKEREPLLTYSRGGNSLNNLQFNIPLSVYTENSDGHTENMFFRYNKPYKDSLLDKIMQSKK